MILFLRELLNVVIMQAQDNTEFKAETIKFIKKTVKEDAIVVVVAQIAAMVPEEKKAAYAKVAKGTLEGLYS